METTIAGIRALHGHNEALPSVKEILATRKHAADVAGQFEALFAQQMISGMRKTSDMGGGEGMFGSGPGSDTYEQWFDTLMSDRLTEGRGLGVRDTLLRHWEERGQIPALPTNGSGAGKTTVLTPGVSR